jgi:hypothetical protein
MFFGDIYLTFLVVNNYEMRADSCRISNEGFANPRRERDNVNLRAATQTSFY